MNKKWKQWIGHVNTLGLEHEIHKWKANTNASSRSWLVIWEAQLLDAFLMNKYTFKYIIM